MGGKGPRKKGVSFPDYDYVLLLFFSRLLPVTHMRGKMRMSSHLTKEQLCWSFLMMIQKTRSVSDI